MQHKKIFHGPSKTLKNISWPINICIKYFMASTKPSAPSPTSYILNVQSLITFVSSAFERKYLGGKSTYLYLTNSRYTEYISNCVSCRTIKKY